MKKYKLCLFYSTKAYKKLIEDEFDDFRKIDELTKCFQNEDELRDDEVASDSIYRIQNDYHAYIEKIKSKKVQKGRIAIVREEDENIHFIKPLYKVSERYASPKALINSIVKRLKRENDIKLLCGFLSNYKSTFYTPFNLYRGVNKIRNSLYYKSNSNTPRSKKEENNYNKMLGIIRETLELPLDRANDTLPEDKLFLYRIMSDYLDSHIYNDKIRINDRKIEVLKDSSLDKEKSNQIVEENILYGELTENLHIEALKNVENSGETENTKKLIKKND